MKIDGTVAFVTGGARGIGRAICEALLYKGGKVCLVDHDGETGYRTESELKAAFPKSDVLFLRCDVTKQEDFVETYKKAELRFGHIEIHVNNAGILSERNWSRMIDVNLKGVIEGTYAAMEHMRKDKGGRGGVVINISSVAGLQPFLYTPVYSAAKAAVVMFTLTWAEEDHFKKHGVRMNVVCPNAVNTEMIINAPSEMYEADKWSELLKNWPMIAPSVIGDVVIQIVEKDQENGKILVVSPEGVQYHQMAQVPDMGAIDDAKAS